ncbi:response regulator [bacterium]|nr:response regulator [bacterium]
MATAKRILVIDDDPNICVTLQDILKAEGYLIWVRESAVQAFQELDSIKPDLILLDIRLPIIDGIDFLHIIKNKGNPAKVIIMTGFNDVSKERAIFMGATNYIRKPFHVEIIKEIIANAVS